MFASEMFAFFFPGSHVPGLYKHIGKSWDLCMPGGLTAAMSPEACSLILSSLRPLQIFFSILLETIELLLTIPLFSLEYCSSFISCEVANHVIDGTWTQAYPITTSNLS